MILKKYFPSALLCLTLLSSHVPNVYSSVLSRQQVIKYIDYVVDSLLLPPTSGCTAEINLFKGQLKDKILTQCTQYSWLIVSRYDSTKVYQFILGEIEEFIERQAYTYALEELSMRNHATSYNQQLASKIKQNLKQEAHSLIMRSDYLDDGRLAKFIGTSLRAKIKSAVQKAGPAPMPSVRPEPQVHYPSDDCPVCLDTFSETKGRLFLECGHNLCAHCLKSWYETKRSAVSCPVCRQAIDIRKYSHILWAPSAPPL